MSRPKHSVQQVLQANETDLEHICQNTWKLRCLNALKVCRTKELGGHIDQCQNPDCKTLHISYNSCRNRHCPQCQGHLVHDWLQARKLELPQVGYFHVVFTLPNSLNPLCLGHPRKLYALLFKTAWSVLQSFAKDPKMLGAKTGMIAILHTWGQNLSLHPHLHCIVPAGGLDSNGQWVGSKCNGKFLFPVKAMAKVFRARFVQGLKRQGLLDYNLTNKLYQKPWVIYAKKPFATTDTLIEYLGRYTHKIAISNHRVKSMEDGMVHFTAKDYKRKGKKYLCKLTQTEFIRRFALHILPKGFVRIRHYGILSSASKKQGLSKIKAVKQGQNTSANATKDTFVIKEEPNQNRTCPKCKKGKLVTLLLFDQRGPPKEWVDKLQKQLPGLSKNRH